LKESFGQLWDYQREGWARRFFDNWRASLKWQRLKPYVQFAEMIERHWEGIAAYSRPENKVSLGFVEGAEQQDQGIPAARLRVEGRGISSAEGAFMHASGILTRDDHPHKRRKTHSFQA
jgi:hypothetical protein